MSDQNYPPGGSPGGPPQQHNPYQQPGRPPYPQQGPGPQQQGPYGGPQGHGHQGPGPQQGPYGGPPQQGPYGGPPQQGPYGGPPLPRQPNPYDRPDPDPWGNPQQARYGPPSQGQPPYGPPGQFGHPQQFQPEPKRRRGKLIPLLAALAVLMVFGAGGAFAYSRIAGGGDQPAAVLPATSVAYARIDMDPSAGQKLAAIRFLMKFPSVKDKLDLTGDNDDLKRKLFDLIKKESGDDLADVDYDADVKPWLGDRAGVAAVPIRDKPEPVIAIQIKDEKQAKAGLDKLFAKSDDKPGLAFYESYVVMAEDQAKADSAVAEAKKSPLTENSAFAKDMDELGEQGVASFWMDTKGIGELAGGELTEDQRKLLPTGSVAGVLRFDASYLELKGIVHGDKSIKAGAAKADEVVTTLPGTTAAAIGFSDGESYVDKVWEAVQKSSQGSGVDLTEMADKFGAQYGIKIPDDLKLLLGKNFVLSVDRTPGDGTPKVAAKVKTDPDRAEAVVDKLINVARTQGNLDIPIAKAKDSETLVVATSKEYADAVLKGGTLGDSESFKQAIPNPKDSAMLGYVDFAAIKSLSPNSVKDDRDYNALKSAGIASRVSGDGEAEFSLRVVVK